uniref:Uncharacterized protein n=1 Tax=Hyaloperonospora arabidopsidis (strain Emoy2) TaxID=559515 RepID=M4BC24_HYAAE
MQHNTFVTSLSFSELSSFLFKMSTKSRTSISSVSISQKSELSISITPFNSRPVASLHTTGKMYGKMA